MFEGSLALPVTGDVPAVEAYFRQRHDRFDADERRALYARVFGDDPGAGAPGAPDATSLLDALVTILLAIAGPEGPSARLLARLTVAARDLAEWLSTRSAGITGFAARSIIEHVRDALGVLGDRQVQAALGGGGPALILRRAGPWVLGRPVDPGPHFDRAQAGQALLSWLADASRALAGGRLSVTRADPVLGAAATWQAVTGLPVPPAQVLPWPGGTTPARNGGGTAT
jgi:hypothetical protein